MSKSNEMAIEEALHEVWMRAWDAAIEHELEMEGRASWEGEGDTTFLWAKERAARDALVKAMLERVLIIQSKPVNARDDKEMV